MTQLIIVKYNISYKEAACMCIPQKGKNIFLIYYLFITYLLPH